MKSQISRHSHDPSKRYSGVFQQQGRMITDADWNEMQAIVRSRLDEALRDVIGGGVPGARPLGLRFTGTTLEILPGVLYAGGLATRVGTPGGAVFNYTTQPDFPSAPGTVALNDVLYVDAWEREVSFLEDPALQDPGLNGADTCTRTQTMLQIKRAPAGFVIDTDPRNPTIGNALLGIGLRRAQSSTDILDPAADEVAIDQPVGNFLFRVEVHDVQGPANNPTSITLKWSSENAAEAYASGTAPPDYKGSDWAYEFHGPVSEKQLGVHLGTLPTRRPLDNGYPVSEPDHTQLPWVRRWDGFCVLNRTGAEWTNASITSGKDRGVTLSSAIADGVHGHAAITATPPTGTPTSVILRLNLQLIDLQLHLKGYNFVIGDHWLAMARDQFVSGQQLLDSRPPIGVVHRYLQLGKVVPGVGAAPLAFQADRPLSFPTLTDLVVDTAGASGARRIGAEAIAGAPSALTTGTVNTQIAALLGLMNTSNQRNDPRYLRRTASVTVQLDNATTRVVFTSLNPPAAVHFNYSDYDAGGTTPKALQQFINGPKTAQIEVRVDRDNQKGVGTITTDIFWHHVFVTNKTSPFAKVQVIVDVFMATPPDVPEKADKEGKETTAEKNDAEKANKESKESKENKETKEGKETKENKETKETKETKEAKDNPDKASKESKEAKEGKESKETTEKQNKENKENKETKENKESKEQTKETKEKEASKDHKEDKEAKEFKDSDDKVVDKGHIGAKEIDTPAPAPGMPASLFALPQLDPETGAVSVPVPAEHRAFIRPDERPSLGDSLVRRTRVEPPSA